MSLVKKPIVVVSCWIGVIALPRDFKSFAVFFVPGPLASPLRAGRRAFALHHGGAAGSNCGRPRRRDRELHRHEHRFAVADEARMAKKSRRRYSRGSGKEVESEMRRYKRGSARSGRGGGKVKSRKQAIAIGLSKARKKGKKVPRKARS
jgi:uncharacterized protein DUF6496